MVKKNSKETNDFFKHFLNRYYFENFKQADTINSIELMVQGECPSKCAYCYLQKYLKYLYPPEIDKEELIIPNLKLVLDWYKKSKFICPLELYSGREFTENGIGWKVFECIYDAFKDSYYKPKQLIIPDDMQFLINPELEKMMDNWIEKFHSIDIYVSISGSIDGLICDKFRYGSRDEEYYTRAFNFMKRHGFNCHPMLSALDIDKWIDNFNWWFNKDPELTINFMLLEVRNHDWTEERLIKYFEFCNYVMNFYWELYNHDLEKMVKYILHLDRDVIGHQAPQIELEGSTEIARERISCSLQNSLHIRLGDLAIVPCHRLAYPQFIGGYLIHDDKEITDIESYNPSFYINTQSYSLNALPKCHKCIYKALCMGGCLGSNYEYSGDPFYQPDNLCALIKFGTKFKLLKLLNFDNNLVLTRQLVPDLALVFIPIIDELSQQIDEKDPMVMRMLEVINNENL